MARARNTKARSARSSIASDPLGEGAAPAGQAKPPGPGGNPGKRKRDVSSNDKGEDKGKGDSQGDTKGDKGQGELSAVPAGLEPPEPAPVGETKAQASNRWDREGRKKEVEVRRHGLIAQYRAAGLTRSAASARAWATVRAEYPPPGVQPAAPPTPAEAPAPTEGVTGLAAIPADWPGLPPNAQLRDEVEWVSANRLVVAEGHTVSLARALSPPPSHAALSWLETSILYPAKFADIAVRAAGQDSAEERELVRRERLALDEVRELLAEMLAERDN